MKCTEKGNAEQKTRKYKIPHTELLQVAQGAG